MATSATGQADADLYQVLRGYAEAGNAHDIDAMMSFIAADCEFYSSKGPNVSGTRYIGSEMVWEGLLYFLGICPDGRWRNLRYLVSGVSRAEGKCTSGAEQNCTTERAA